MSHQNAALKKELMEELDQLAPEGLIFLKALAELLRFQEGQKPPGTPYVPIAMGGLWHGINITEEDLVEVRRDMWAKLESMEI